MTAGRTEWSGDRWSDNVRRSADVRWAPDVLRGYRQTTLALGPDPDSEGELFATLVSRDGDQPADRAVLAVHGYTDYFFNTALVDFFAERGYRMYGLDLHKCGRSLRSGQTPHFTTDLSRYDRDLEAALAIIRAENRDAQTVVYGHSTGGLVVSLWLDRVRRRGDTRGLAVSGLVLNSPFLDLHGPAILRTPVTYGVMGAAKRVNKTRVVRAAGKGGYGTTLHRDYDGEFDYDLRWKPVGGFPITVGWVHAVRRGQALLHQGLDVGVPNLVLRSDHSVSEKATPEQLHRGDAVLDVSHIARWAGCIGNRQTIVPVVDAKHDVFLSLAGPRATAYAELDRWLAQI